eukprot:1146966-Pelagomonas_calceolata.AAC.5
MEKRTHEAGHHVSSPHCQVFSIPLLAFCFLPLQVWTALYCSQGLASEVDPLEPSEAREKSNYAYAPAFLPFSCLWAPSRKNIELSLLLMLGNASTY